MPIAIQSPVLSALTAASVTVFVLAALVFLGPTVESTFWPVVSDVSYQVVRRNDERMTLDWWGDKQRTTCAPVSASALVQRGPHMVLADLSKADDGDDKPLPLVVRPPGVQQFRRMDVIPSGTAITLLLRHTCHPLWPSVTYVQRRPLP